MLEFDDWIARLWDDSARFVWQHANSLSHPVGWRGEDSELPHNVWLYVEYGCIAGAFVDEPVYLPRGTAAWLPAGTRRHIHCDGNKDALTRRIVFDLLDADGRQLLFSESPLILPGASHQIAYHQLLAGIDSNDLVECKSLVAALAASCMRHKPAPATAFRTFSHGEQQRIEHYIMERVNQTILPAKLATIVSMSPDYFSRVFKATYGIAPKSYVMQQRIRNAAQLLLESSLTIAELCAQIGENDISKFCHQFRKVMGCTPTHYRRQGY